MTRRRRAAMSGRVSMPALGGRCVIHTLDGDLQNDLRTSSLLRGGALDTRATSM